MRHAKSSWSDDTLPDHDRPLNHRGLNDAPHMAKWLHKQGLSPQLVVSSSANRAKSTAQLLLEQGLWESPLIIDKRLYHASAHEMIEVAREIDDSVSHLMLVGHNPGMEQFAGSFAAEHIHFPTAAIAHIELDIEYWLRFTVNTKGKLRNVWRPKELSI